MANAFQSTSDFKGDHLSVKMFGAIGDGTTDDTTAFQNALTAAAGKDLYVPPGTYKITSTLSIPTKTALLGSPGETIILSFLGNAPLISLDKPYPTIKNLWLRQDPSVTPVSGNCGIRSRFTADDYSATAPSGASLPATATVGDYFRLTTDPPGEQGYYCYATNTWTKIYAASVFYLEDIIVGSNVGSTSYGFYNGIEVYGAFLGGGARVESSQNKNHGFLLYSSQQIWRDCNAMFNLQHGLKTAVAVLPFVGGTDPWMYGFGSFNNGGWGVHAEGPGFVEFSGFFLNNDSQGEVYSKTTNNWVMHDGIIQWAGTPLLVTADFPIVANAPSIYVDPAGSTSVSVSRVSIGYGTGNGYVNDKVEFYVSDCDINAGGYAIYNTGGFGRVSGNVCKSPVYCAGQNNRITQNYFRTSTIGEPALYVPSGTEVTIHGNQMFATVAEDVLKIDTGVTVMPGSNILQGTLTDNSAIAANGKWLAGMQLLPSGAENQTLRRSATEWVATSNVVNPGATAGAGADSLKLYNENGSPYSESGLGFYTNAQAGANNVLTGRIYGKFDGSGFGNQRMTLQVGDGGGVLRDVLWIKADLYTYLTDALVIKNDKKVFWEDSGGTARAMLHMDGSNNFHVGPQAAVTGDGYTSFYVDGTKALTLGVSGIPVFYPETDLNVSLGQTAKRYKDIHANGLALTTDAGGAAAFLNIGSGTAAEAKSVQLRGPSTFGANDSYVLYMPDTDGSSGQVLTTDGSGVLSWSSGLPASDATAIVKGSSDATKLLRFEVDGFTTSTTRVLTPPDADMTLAGQNYANVFTLSQTFANNTKLSWKDSGGTARDFVFIDGSNDAHVGFQSSPASGNGALSLYVKGTKALTLLTTGIPELYPETDLGVNIGKTTKRYKDIHANGLSLTTNAGGAAAYINLGSGTAAEARSVQLRGPSTFGANDSYTLYFPDTDGSSGQALVTDGSGVLSWASATMPAGTANYTLRYDDGTSAWVASGALQNDGSVVSIYNVGVRQYRFGTGGNWASFHAGGTSGSPSATAASDMMGVMSGRGYHSGGAYSATGNALVGFYAAENFTPTAHGAYITFSTTPTGSTTAAERARFTDDGNLLVGTTDNDGTPATGRLVVQGSTNTGATNIFVGRDSSGANVFTLDTDGNATVAAGSYIQWSGRARLSSDSGAQLMLDNTSGTGVGFLQFGGYTSSYAGWKNSGAEMLARKADDSGYAIVDMLSLKIGGTSRIDSSGQILGAAIYSGGNLVATASGVLQSATGYSGTVSIRKGDDSGSLSMVVASGVITSIT